MAINTGIPVSVLWTVLILWVQVCCYGNGCLGWHISCRPFPYGQSDWAVHSVKLAVAKQQKRGARNVCICPKCPMNGESVSEHTKGGGNGDGRLAS